MPTSDRELPETLDLIARLVASVSDRLDRQAEALDYLMQAQDRFHAQAQAAQATQARMQVEPDRVALVTAQSVHRTLGPELDRIRDTMAGLTGGKALLRERWRVFDAEEARQGRWRFQPWAVVLGIPLALGLLLAVLMPGAVAQTPFTCRAVGGEWWDHSERYSAACLFEAYGRLRQATGVPD